MEQNDKILREKLSNFIAPFDAAAWNKMEQMLLQKKKRKFLAWWWFGGTSLAAVLAAVSLFLIVPKQESNVSNNKEQNNALTAASKQTEVKQTAQAANTQTENKNSFTSTTSLSISNTTTPIHQNEKTGWQKTNNITAHNFTTPSSSKYRHQNTPNSELTTTAKQPTQSLNLPTQNSSIHSLTLLSAKEIAAMDSKLSLQNEQEKNSVLLPVKKKKYRYELGVNSGVFAVALNKNFMHQSSWFLGVQEAYRFGKYISFTDGFYYSQTSLSQQFPSTDSTADLKKYSTQFHALTLALGVNVYPISTSKIDWYWGVGVFNNFKVKETIAYELDYQKSTTTLDNLGNQVPISNLNSGNLESKTSEAELQKGYGTKFYTANLYTTTGIEAKLYKGLRLNAGVQYQLGLFKNINKQSHPHFVGGELGLRYRF
jgi:hypothetical protein